MESPLISIIISVHNGAGTLPRALRSITDQTFKNYEIIIIDDASTDTTGKILTNFESSTSEVCQVIKNTQNLGLTKSLNKGIKSARGPYVARLDADDWWQPEKVQKQINFLQSHPDHGLVGTQYINHYPTNTIHSNLPQADSHIRRSIFRRNPFAHSSVIFKRNIWEAVGGYDESLHFGQDLDLWFRFLPHTKMANLPEYLCHRTVTAHTNRKLQAKQHIRTTAKYIRQYNAPKKNYVYLAESLTVLCAPSSILKRARYENTTTN